MNVLFRPKAEDRLCEIFPLKQKNLLTAYAPEHTLSVIVSVLSPLASRLKQTKEFANEVSSRTDILRA